MQRLTEFGIKNTRFTLFVMGVLILSGLSAYTQLSKREDPAISIRTAVIEVYYPGMSPERMETLIVEPVERTVRQISEIDDIKVLISTGSAVLYLDIYDSVPKAQMADVFQDIRNKVIAASDTLPEGTSGPYINTDYGDVVIATIAVTGDGYSYAELRDSARALRKKLYTVEGIGKVTLSGVQKERVWLEIDSRKLASVGVQLPRLLNDLRTQNVILPAGKIDADGTNIIIEADGDLESIESIENVLTRIPESANLVRLKDILHVRRGYEEPKNNPVYFNGNPAIMLGVQMSDGQDIQVLGKALKSAVDIFESTQPMGIQYEYSTYQETDVTQSINNALGNVIQTIAVVVFVLIIFLGIRPALIVACIVPFTVMFAIIVMNIVDINLHIVSIAAVIIALGLLVDNGLVIVEDLQNRMAGGEDASSAALATSRQFSIPLGVASITTIMAFLPLLLLEGTDGEYGYALGAVVAIILTGSWLVALYLLPALSLWLSKKQSRKSSMSPTFLVARYSALIQKILPFSILIAIASYGAVTGSLAIFDGLKNQMFPLTMRSQFLVYMDMPRGTSISETERKALAVEKWFLDKDINPEIVNTTLYVGSGGPRFYLSLRPAETVPSSAFMLINVRNYEDTLVAVKRAREYLLEFHPEARFKVKQLSFGGTESGIVEVKISGEDANMLLSAARQIEAGFADAPGIVQNENDWGNKVAKAVINIAQDKARNYGVTSRDISHAMDAYISGSVVSEYREGDQSIPIVVRSMEAYRDSIEDLDGITIPVDGKIIALEQVSVITPVFELSQMRRENLERVITVTAQSSVLSAQELIDFIQPSVTNLHFPDGYSVKFDGEIKNSRETNEKLAVGIVPAIIIMFAAIMFQFNSFRRVILVFATIPFILVGSPVALLITGQPFSFFATLGLISLAGIIINNAIVLIDQIDIERQSTALAEAIVSASQKRVTPITLTTLTTVTGLLPMAVQGGPLFQPMAILMIGGLSVASLISLFFVPCAYYLLFRGDEFQAKGVISVKYDS